MKTCSVDGCDQAVVAHGLCSRHYMRQRRGRPLEARGNAPAGEGRFIGFRVTADEREAMEKAAGKKSLSEWIRSVVLAALPRGEK